MSNKTEPVKFGTDGWRGIIADTYTYDNLRRVALATAKVFKDHPKTKTGFVIGYDTRFQSKQFAEAVAEVIANQNIKVLLTDSYVTTPTVSLLTRDLKCALGVMITASHNPAIYNGYKLKDEFGGSMDPDEIAKIEKELENIKDVEVAKSVNELLNEGMIEYYKGEEYYQNYLKNRIDIEKIKSGNLKVIYDAMYGAGQNLINKFVEIRQLHGEINPSFGKSAPEPVEKNLSEICGDIKNGDYNIGIVTDGDADRIAIIDEKGDFLDAQKTFAILLKYLFERKKLTGKVVRGFSTSELIKRYCEKNGIELVTVPIGFKHISKIMISDDVLIGAEESGGIGIKGHLPERDGIYNGMLYMELLADYGKSISELKAELDEEFGKYFYQRNDVRTTEEKKIKALETCAKIKAGDEFGGKKVADIETLDGFKFFFDNGWIIVRASGTEPLLRIYCETTGADNTKEILSKAINQLEL
ncbi:MAG TPA: phosphoglucomutase/phosphomannomutase family protein [Ignavibacteria bacterium]|nr:phosphoglucomutase/phosphomannomutase family protein [Ignavibacteria bacterium]HMR40238.1 phosphoglucomutase/phosphomannomutase family protein [Ignavibacteria bacterium]